MDKLYNREYFENKQVPALNADNLNELSRGLSELDDRVLEMYEQTENIRDTYEAAASAEAAAASAAEAEAAAASTAGAAESAEAAAASAAKAAASAAAALSSEEMARAHEESAVVEAQDAAASAAQAAASEFSAASSHTKAAAERAEAAKSAAAAAESAESAATYDSDAAQSATRAQLAADNAAYEASNAAASATEAAASAEAAAASKVTVTNNLLATTAGTALDATQGKVLNEKIETVDERLGVDIKIVDGVPQWSARGADTYSPFNTGGLNELTMNLRAYACGDLECLSQGYNYLTIPSASVESIEVELTDFDWYEGSEAECTVNISKCKNSYGGTRVVLENIYTTSSGENGSISVSESQLDSSNYPYVEIYIEVYNQYGDTIWATADATIKFK